MFYNIVRLYDEFICLWTHVRVGEDARGTICEFDNIIKQSCRGTLPPFHTFERAPCLLYALSSACLLLRRPFKVRCVN